ncbi:hypothetical protein [Ruegeria atlantica]|uniref:hypothetical protein n=1 Tax=Ruegeria atlantica TaxID=81569 RepID=UPI00147B6F5E|nr:hypothetical protein [Ruegeria atlantica]
MSLIVLTQSIAVSGIRTIKRLSQLEQQDLLEDSIRELARPLIADAMLSFGEIHSLPLNSSPYPVTIDGQFANLIVQDVNGLIDLSRTPRDVVKRLLPEDLGSIVMTMKSDGQIHTPLRQRFIEAGGDPNKYPDIEQWVTIKSNSSRINMTNLPRHYQNDLTGLPQSNGSQQPQEVSVLVTFN